jgi:hypothetical protein
MSLLRFLNLKSYHSSLSDKDFHSCLAVNNRLDVRSQIEHTSNDQIMSDRQTEACQDSKS